MLKLKPKPNDSRVNPGQKIKHKSDELTKRMKSERKMRKRREKITTLVLFYSVYIYVIKCE